MESGVRTVCFHGDFTIKPVDEFIEHSWKKGCCTPIWGNKIDMDLIFVLPVGWNWHEMYLWLLPNEIRPYLGWTSISMPSGIAEVQIAAYVVIPQNLPSHCGKFESTAT